VAAGGRLTAWRAVPDGVELRIKAQPRARRTALLGLMQGLDGPRLRLSVQAVPEDGRANRAICDLLARALHVAPSGIAVVQGNGVREKTCHIAGDPAALIETLEKLA
jgi:uncharacterized protein YggU (UPF0235/DUF167 family)